MEMSSLWSAASGGRCPEKGKVLSEPFRTGAVSRGRRCATLSTEAEDAEISRRVELVLAHWAGQINATQAARELGVSRNTFYGWLKRAKAEMLAALQNRPSGRPLLPRDPEKEALQAEVERLEQELVVLAGRRRI